MDVRERFERPLVLDGGLATQLERLGADLADELWSARVLIDDPNLIRRAHLDYFEAGADVAISASYQASFEGFARRGIDRDDAARLMRTSVAIAREAAEERAAKQKPTSKPDRDGGPLVAASVGPYGAILADGSEYDGRYGKTVAELAEFHRPRLEVLLGAEPDVIAIETIPSLLEAEALVRVLEEVGDVRAWMTFSCRDAEHLNEGSLFVDAAQIAASSRHVIAVGVNCTPPQFVEGLVGTLPETFAKPLVVYPNLGSTWDAEHKRWIVDGARPDFAARAREWIAAGATAIGGCCGTGPSDIAAIDRFLEAA
jgi:homocysteine S-methyltransferase